MTQVRLVVPAGDVDDASGRLWAYEPVAVSEAPAGEGVELLAGFPDVATAAMVAEAMPERWAPTMESDPPDAWWLDVWREHVEPVQVGDVVLWPAWWEDVPPSGVTAVRLDAGRAFGDGAHPSTRQALRLMQRVVARDTSVLDVGCGSGVLAVTAALLGAGPVLALDVDPEAVRATRANAARNGVDVRLVEGLDEVTEPVDVVLANIGAGVLTALALDLCALTRPSGWLVLAGLLPAQVPATVAPYGASGCRIEAVLEDDGWAAVLLRR